jgi:copper homeostasis protein
VFGVLTAEGELDVGAMRSLVSAAAEMQTTCHRAVDQVRDVLAAVDTLAGLGVSRILSSGQEETPLAGVATLARMVEQAAGRVGIMAAGVTPEDTAEIVRTAGVDEVHSAALTWRGSEMSYVSESAKMGHGRDFSLGVVDGEVVRAIRAALPPPPSAP